jgi:hypothetical protein
MVFLGMDVSLSDAGGTAGPWCRCAHPRHARPRAARVIVTHCVRGRQCAGRVLLSRRIVRLRAKTGRVLPKR